MTDDHNYHQSVQLLEAIDKLRENVIDLMTIARVPKWGNRIDGHCPACRGGGTLFVASGGYITCGRLDCPDPSAAHDLLARHAPGNEPEPYVPEYKFAVGTILVSKITGSHCTVVGRSVNGTTATYRLTCMPHPGKEAENFTAFTININLAHQWYVEAMEDPYEKAKHVKFATGGIISKPAPLAAENVWTAGGHVAYECDGKACLDKQSCMFCDGGLSLCTRCGSFEGATTTDCPGLEIPGDVLNDVYAGKIDFRDGQWVPDPSPWTPNGRAKGATWPDQTP